MVKVWCVVIVCDIVLLLVGGIMFEGMVVFCVVGVFGFGLGLVFYMLGLFVDVVC